MTVANHVVVGEETLHLMSEMETFNQWMFDSIRPYIGQRVLEAGAGIGNFTGRLVDRDLLVALELEADRVERLRRRFADAPHVRAEVGDLTDSSLLRLAHYQFAPGGRLLLLVPAHPALYSSLDVELGHYRRYREGELQTLLEGVGFRIERRFYLNLFGVFGWWLNGRVLKRRLLPRGQLGVYERLAPVFRGIEEGTGRRWGLSVVFVAQKVRA